MWCRRQLSSYPHATVFQAWVICLRHGMLLGQLSKLEDMQCPNSKSSTTHGRCFSTACLSSPLTSRDLEICTLEHASCCSRSFPAWVGSEKQFFGPCYATRRRLPSTSWCPTGGKMWLCFNIPLFVWQMQLCDCPYVMLYALCLPCWTRLQQ